MLRAELRNPLMLHRLYRSQVLIGHGLFFVGVFMLLNTPRPSLWLLEEWGGLQIPSAFWGILFGVTGFVLARSRRVVLALTAASFAFIQLMTVGAAGWLTQGPNVMTVLAGVLAIHAAWTAVDLHILLREDTARRLG